MKALFRADVLVIAMIGIGALRGSRVICQQRNAPKN